MKQNLDLAIQKKRFIQFLFKSGKSEKTVENYNRYLNHFLKHTSIKKINGINQRTISSYKFILKESGLAKKTQNYHLSALRMFVKFLKSQNLFSFDFKKIKLNNIKKETFSDIDMEYFEKKLLFTDCENIKHLRDKAILIFLLFFGLKVSELCLLNKKDVDFNRNKLKIRRKKSDFRIVDMNDEIKNILEDYLSLRGDEDVALFVNNGKRKSKDGTMRITSRTVQRIVKIYAEKSGMPDVVTPSKLRHAFAKKMFEDGKSIVILRDMLGYKSLNTVKKYMEKLQNS